jgi:hypothetical protein
VAPSFSSVGDTLETLIGAGSIAGKPRVDGPGAEAASNAVAAAITKALEH